MGSTIASFSGMISWWIGQFSAENTIDKINQVIIFQRLRRFSPGRNASSTVALPWHAAIGPGALRRDGGLQLAPDVRLRALRQHAAAGDLRLPLERFAESAGGAGDAVCCG